MENGGNEVLDKGSEPRISTTDSCVSISLNDSWTGRKLLESFGYDYNSYVTSEEFNVRNFQFIIFGHCPHFGRTHHPRFFRLYFRACVCVYVCALYNILCLSRN